MGKLVKALSKSEFADQTACVVSIGDKEIALFKLNGQFHALDNNCTHRGGPLSEGETDGNVVICPWHGFQFDITTGHCATHTSFKQTSYRVEVKGDEIWIEI